VASCDSTVKDDLSAPVVIKHPTRGDLPTLEVSRQHEPVITEDPSTSIKARKIRTGFHDQTASARGRWKF
jgi:hypothetical protein